MITTKLTFDPSGWLEINYIHAIQLPDVVVPEVPAVLDEEGNEVTPAVPETTTPGGTQSVVLQCTSYHPTQLELIHADCATHGVTIEGDDAAAVAQWVADYVPPPPAPTPVPQIVTMRQARLALLVTGRLNQIAGILDGIPDEGQKQAAKIEWEYAAEVHRNHGLMNAMRAALGMTEADMDDLFIIAAGL